MNYQTRIPKDLFRTDGHFLGRPANFGDRIVARRIRLLEKTPNFIAPNCSLLNIGCGNGASMFLLSDRMKTCTGIEITDQHKASFNTYKLQHKIENCHYKIVDVVKSKAVEKFDRIISFEVIEHLENETGLQYYYDSLKHDGLLAISVPNKWWIFETHGAKLPLIPWNRVPLFSWLPRFIHERLANARIYTKKRIQDLLKSYGFEVLELSYITAPMDVLPHGKFKNWIIENIFPHDTTEIAFKATSIFVVATK